MSIVESREPAPELPRELIEHILSYLHDDFDFDSIRRCAVISQAWLWPARALIFHEVNMSNGRTWDKLQEAIRSTPALASLIRIFNVTDQKKFVFHALVGDTVIHPGLTGVSHLRITSTSRDYPLSTWSNVLAPNATTLELRRADFKTSKDFFGVVSARPFVRNMSLRDIAIKDGMSEGVFFAPNLINLTMDSDVVHLLNDVDNVDLKITPREILVEFMDESTLPSLAKLLRRIGSSLEAVSMTFHQEVYGAVWDAIPLKDRIFSHAKRLRKLHFTNLSSQIFRLAPVLFGMLRNVSSEHVEEITLELRLRNKANLNFAPNDPVTSEYPAVEDLMSLLEEPRFARLRLFHLDIHFTSGSRLSKGNWGDKTTVEDITRGVEVLFPLLHARGVLKSTFHFPNEKHWKGEMIVFVTQEA